MRTERLLLGAAFTTVPGNNVQLITGALLMIRQQHTMPAVGWLFVAVALPQAVLSPFFGRIADHRAAGRTSSTLLLDRTRLTAGRLRAGGLDPRAP